ncbi:hypothetical protein F5Y16DRAFT_406414 [Xylariaceae sp. FL0255]|nr:hypothetical protein F5Y16DRAFT_406414 [Xylariaceae sp. FL0255]
MKFTAVYTSLIALPLSLGQNVIYQAYQGQTNGGSTCTGASLGRSAQSGPGTGPYVDAGEGACVLLAGLVGDSSLCHAQVYSEPGCNDDDFIEAVDLTNEGDSYNINFSSFEAFCG